jgi:enoyl-CoA hydratase/carnithine racemase
MPDESAGHAIGVSRSGSVTTVELQRPPNNFFNTAMVATIADALEEADRDRLCRAIVLAAAGKHFCAGADLANDPVTGTVAGAGPHIYQQALRLFRTAKPIVAAVHGAAVGGGLGLALVADFRITCPAARFTANFTRLGFHPGFGLTVTLPGLVGAQQAALLFYTGRRIGGAEAVRIGLADRLVGEAEVREAATDLAAEIAASAPLAVLATRETLRRGLAERIAAATERELVEQDRLRRTEDFREGVRASAERRAPRFSGR